MSRRTNPWPALVDFFSALLVAIFAGFILVVSEPSGTKTGKGPAEVDPDPAKVVEGKISFARKKAGDIAKSLSDALRQQSTLKGKLSECGDDACIDLYTHFGLNRAEIAAGQIKALQSLCANLKAALDNLPKDQMGKIAIIVEGHTDRNQVLGSVSPRTAYLFNWDLSSKRAASVLYEFSQCKLKPPRYSIAMIGYADSERACQGATAECDEQNRRTTLRLQVDTWKIQKDTMTPQLGKQP